MSDATIDTSALTKLKDMIGGDVEDLAELVEDFLATVPEQLAEMRTAGDQEDWAALRIAAHSCKSNARDLGATDLCALCAALELQCKQGAPMDLPAQLAAIETAAQRSMTALREQDLASV